MLKWSSKLMLNSFRLMSLSKSQITRWNHYKALGLPPSASSADIKAAYYKLSKKYHPDRNNGSEASAKKFRDIVAAYEVLGKAKLRQEYDREINRKPNFGNKKKVAKRIRKGSTAPKTIFKSDMHSRPKQKSSGGKKALRKFGRNDFDNFVIHAIPLVVACFMSYKKH